GLAVMKAVNRPPTPAPVTLAPPPPAAAPLPLAAAPAAASGDLRPVDQDALALLARPVGGKMKDATAGKPYKINLYSDDGRRWSRLKVDLDRDDRWDESWT